VQTVLAIILIAAGFAFIARFIWLPWYRMLGGGRRR
jgi:hypothetical protein